MSSKRGHEDGKGTVTDNGLMATSPVRSLYMTFPDESSAVKAASALLDEKLIACANVFPGGRSLYRWEGELQDDPEVVMIAKTQQSRVAETVERVRELHPFDTPCIVALQAVDGYQGYLDWVLAETGDRR